VRLVLHPAALAELVEAAGFYEAQATGLGLDFFHEVERILRILEDDPEVASVFDPPYRRYLCRRFPSRWFTESWRKKSGRSPSCINAGVPAIGSLGAS
jgi:hypothetical protein